MKRNTFAMLFASTLVGATSAQGSIIVYSENFENDTIGNLPTIAGPDVGDGYQGLFNSMSVQANPESTVGSGNTSTNALRGGGVVNNNNRLQALFEGGAQQIDGMVISWDFYNQGGGFLDTNDSVRVAFFDGDGTVRDVFMRNDRDGLIILDTNQQLDDDDQLDPANFGEGVWQNMVAEFTLDSGTNYTLDWTITNLENSSQVSGSQAVTIAASGPSGSLADGTALGLHFEINDTNDNATNYFGYLDNVTVEVVPEPASLALLAMGGLLMTTRRRR